MSDEEELKKAINNFIWEHAPGHISINQAEQLAIRILESFGRLPERPMEMPAPTPMRDDVEKEAMSERPVL